MFCYKTSVGENIYHISQQRRNVHIMNGIRAGRFSSERVICQLISQPYYSLNGLTTDLKRILAAFKGVHLSQVYQQNKKCTNRIEVHHLLGWCT